MPDVCRECGHRDDVRRFCPACGAEQLRPRAPDDDPLIGSLIAERYEVTGLVNQGGMGRVYRAVQRPLDRTVAIKCVHPHLLASAEVVSRFLREARSMSRIHHPNVVSIFDFGRAGPPAGDYLYLVMELVSGPDLSTLIGTGQVLDLKRIASIMRQTLAALAEAHHVGIVHRDVKPNNIVLAPRRGGGDLVKVIDFGIAGSGGRAITESGYTFGTPHYMSPEQASGEAAGPSADLYAAGIVLYELVTGTLPFRHSNPAAVLAMQVSAPRPDPRERAPERRIDAALAEVCMRAIAIDPSHRYPTAESFATALTRVSRSAASPHDDSSLLPESSPGDGGELRLPTRIPAYRPPAESLANTSASPLVGRADVLSSFTESLADRHVGAFVVWGRTGTGRSRLLREIVMWALGEGYFVTEAILDPPPLFEIGFGGLREMLVSLSDERPSPTNPLAQIAGADSTALASLRAVWADDDAGVDFRTLRTAAVTALRWAIDRALERSGGATIVLVVDDLDRMDRASRLALDEVMRGERIRKFFVVASSEEPPAGWPSHRMRLSQVESLTPAQAANLLGDPRLASSLQGPIEPLFVEQLRRFREIVPDAATPPDLTTLIEQHVLSLSPLERRVLQTVAATGGGPVDDIAAVLDRPEDLGTTLRPLCDAGLIEVHQASIRLTHAVYGRIAIAIAPAADMEALHGRVASVLADAGASVELRAHHAVRGPPGLGAFALVAETARLRSLRGDFEGVIAACWDGIHAAEAIAAAGDASAALDSRRTFNEQLGHALVELRRFHEAHAAFARALELTEAHDARAARLCEGLSLVAQHLRRPGEAERWRQRAKSFVSA